MPATCQGRGRRPRQEDGGQDVACAERGQDALLTIVDSSRISQQLARVSVVSLYLAWGRRPREGREKHSQLTYAARIHSTKFQHCATRVGRPAHGRKV